MIQIASVFVDKVSAPFETIHFDLATLKAIIKPLVGLCKVSPILPLNAASALANDVDDEAKDCRSKQRADHDDRNHKFFAVHSDLRVVRLQIIGQTSR